MIYVFKAISRSFCQYACSHFALGPLQSPWRTLVLVLNRPQAPSLKKSTKKKKSVDLNVDFFVYIFEVEGLLSRIKVSNLFPLRNWFSDKG